MRSTETPEHKRLAGLIRKFGFTEPVVAFHVRNERGTDWERMQAGQMGILTGIPDWIFIKIGGVVAIEMKPIGWKAQKVRTGNYNKHELRQLEVHGMLRSVNACVGIAETAEEAVSILERYGIFLNPMPISEMRIRAAFSRDSET